MYFFNRNFCIIWYLKPFVSSKRSLNKFLMVDLRVSNWINEVTIGGSGSGKTKILLHLIKKQDDFDKIFLYAKDLSEPKYQFLIKKHKNAGTKHLNDLKAFIECSNTMHNVYDDINDYNLTRKRKLLIAFDDMIKDIMSNKTISSCCEKIVY